MAISLRRPGALKISAILALAVGGALWGQQTQPGGAAATAPATTTPARQIPGIDPTLKMSFVFVDVPVAQVLTNMSERLGFVIINTGALPVARITVQKRQEVNAQEAITLFNEILVPLGYVALVTNVPPDPTTGVGGSTILRVVTVAEGKKANIPVIKGNDPNSIPLSDELRTQIIQLNTISATGLVNDLRPLISADADVTANSGSNSIIITDTAAKIRRLAEIIQGLDSAKKATTVYQYRQLINSNASEAARLINAMFSPQNTGVGTAAGGIGGGGAGAGGTGVPAGGRGAGAAGRGGGGGAGGTAITGRIYADSDTRTNTVILTGPDDQVQQALDMLNRIEAIPQDYLNTTVFFIKNLKNAQTANVTPVLNQIFGNGNAGGAGGAARGATGTRAGGTTGGAQQRGGTGTGGAQQRGGTRAGANLQQLLPEQTFEVAAGGGGGGARGGAAAGGGGARGGAAAGGAAGGARAGAAGGAAGGARGGTTGAAAALSGQAFFVANADSNSILVTTDRLYEEKVRAIIDELDRPVPQVLIKVLIAEVTHSNGDDIGVEFGFGQQRTATDFAGNAVNFGPFGGTDFGIRDSAGGFKIGLVEGQVSATLKAMAHQNKLDVLSRPYILVQANQEAYMQIGQSVPYITNSQISNTGQTINSVAYTNVGVILSAIPYINPDGQVTLDIAPQVSALDPSSGVPISSNVIAPVFTVRQAQSRVTIKNGETIVIGGLMQDQKTQVINKVPLLGDIPYLGMLFKETLNAKVKTELLIFLTPHVAMDPGMLKGMSAAEEAGLKLVPQAVQPGMWEQEKVGMERGATTTRPATEIRIQNGNLVPAPSVSPNLP